MRKIVVQKRDWDNPHQATITIAAEEIRLKIPASLSQEEEMMRVAFLMRYADKAMVKMKEEKFYVTFRAHLNNEEGPVFFMNDNRKLSMKITL